jgi:hypothetical protein
MGFRRGTSRQSRERSSTHATPGWSSGANCTLHPSTNKLTKHTCQTADSSRLSSRKKSSEKNDTNTNWRSNGERMAIASETQHSSAFLPRHDQHVGSSKPCDSQQDNFGMAGCRDCHLASRKHILTERRDIPATEPSDAPTLDRKSQRQSKYRRPRSSR